MTSHFVVLSYGDTGTESAPSNELELAYAAVAAVVDSDADALTDAAEDRDLDRGVDAGETDRHNPDTDGDGYLDGAEVAAGTNPLDPNDPGDVHPTVTPTPTRTATPVAVTATTTPIPTATVTVSATATGTTTPVPTATATPTSASCGNEQRESAEQCDGADADSCAGLCLPDCTCAASYRFPFEGWTEGRTAGTWTVANDPESGGPVLAMATDQGTKFSIVYPARATLSVPMPLASFTVRGTEAFSIALTVEATNGRAYVLAYSADDGVPTTHRRTATFPLGRAIRGSALQTTIRDLAADLRTGFGVELAAVEQAELAGALEIAELTLFAAGGVVLPVAAEELALPLAGWNKRGSGMLELDANDRDLDGPTLRAIPRNADRPRIAAEFPDSRDALAAAFRTLSLVVRTDGELAIEVDVRLAAGEASLVYESGIASLVVRGSRLTVPLTSIPIDGSPYELVVLDLDADVRRGLPGAELRGILNVRLRGPFEVGSIVLQDPID